MYMLRIVPYMFVDLRKELSWNMENGGFFGEASDDEDEDEDVQLDWDFVPCCSCILCCL